MIVVSSSIVIRRERDSGEWIIEMNIRGGKEKIVLSRGSWLEDALKQGLDTVAEIMSLIITYGQYYCSGMWKDIRNLVIDMRITPYALLDASDILEMCKESSD